MADGVLRGILPGDVRVVVALVTDAAREARARHRLAPTSAVLLGQALAAGVLLAALQKGASRVNLQLECDGQLNGLFVDAGADGTVRGYAKNPNVDLELGRGEFRWRGALGNSGFLSVLRDIGAEYYRSSVELEDMDLARDLDRYFVLSDQVPTRVALAVRRDGPEPLGAVAGVLAQVLPDGDREALTRLGDGLQASLELALSALERPDPQALFSALFPGIAPLEGYPVAFRCTCSKGRALETIRSLGVADVQHLVDTLGSTAVTCHFCGAKYEITLPDLLQVLEALGAGTPKS